MWRKGVLLAEASLEGGERVTAALCKFVDREAVDDTTYYRLLEALGLSVGQCSRCVVAAVVV